MKQLTLVLFATGIVSFPTTLHAAKPLDSLFRVCRHRPSEPLPASRTPIVNAVELYTRHTSSTAKSVGFADSSWGW